MSRALDGVLVVDKPPGLTSHDVVARVRRALGVKAGHTGTLDPAATGVLAVLVGKATRLMRFYQGDDKVYDARLKLGETTDTCDAQGVVVSVRPVPPFERPAALRALSDFLGPQSQTPPMYSAVKIQGQPLYKAARRGEVVERKPRPIEIFSLDLLELGRDSWRVRVHCSSGTYVRSLAHDLGQRLGCGAHLSALRRLRSGPFDLSQAVTLDEAATAGPDKILPLERLLPDFPAVDMDDAQTEKVRHGNPIPITIPGEVFRLLSAGRLVALAMRRGESAAPVVVFEPG